MIKDIIDLLNTNEWMIGDEDIDFAMGINKLPRTFKETKQIIRRKNGNRSK